MKIIRFLGGLGNQMFQYAFYKALQKRHQNVKADVQGFKDYSLHNGLELENIFDITLNKASAFTSNLYYIHNRSWPYRKLRAILNIKKNYEEELSLFSFDPTFLENAESAYYWGYWQNELYFKDIADDLRKDLEFKNPLTERNQDLQSLICKQNSVSIHVRRGDYIENSLLGGLCGKEYYQKAIDYINLHVETPTFFIFSDDIAWCTENLNLTNSSFISWNKGLTSYVDMQLMSCCKHQIIANSSFSWWGAWLNSNPKKIVIGPKKWTNDSNHSTQMLFPDNWIKL